VVGEARRDPVLRQRVGEQVVGAAYSVALETRFCRLHDGEQRVGDGGWPEARASPPMPPSSAATRASSTAVVGFMMRV